MSASGEGSAGPAAVPHSWLWDGEVPSAPDSSGAGLPARPPRATHARVGLYCYDTMTLVGPGSWPAIRGAADAALTAAELIAAGRKLDKDDIKLAVNQIEALIGHRENKRLR